MSKDLVSKTLSQVERCLASLEIPEIQSLLLSGGQVAGIAHGVPYIYLTYPGGRAIPPYYITTPYADHRCRSHRLLQAGSRPSALDLIEARTQTAILLKALKTEALKTVRDIEMNKRGCGLIVGQEATKQKIKRLKTRFSSHQVWSGKLSIKLAEEQLQAIAKSKIYTVSVVVGSEKSRTRVASIAKSLGFLLADKRLVTGWGMDYQKNIQYAYQKGAHILIHAYSTLNSLRIYHRQEAISAGIHLLECY